MLRRFAIALVLLAVTSLTVAAPAQASEPRSKAERAFLTDMVSHHAMAVDMAEMAMERAAHPELKAMAEQIIATQTAEIRRMRAWLKRWYGKSVDPMMGHGHMGHEMAQMEELARSTTPAEFEVRFMALMTMHHTQALERARAVRDRPIHAKTRALTADIIAAQQREIDQMRAWLVAWYAN
jgi:uncharacterized protein (DUF305 family)